MSLADLNQSGTSTSNPALYQAIKELITQVTTINLQLPKLVSNTFSNLTILNPNIGPVLTMDPGTNLAKIRIGEFTTPAIQTPIVGTFAVNLSWDGANWNFDDISKFGLLFQLSTSDGFLIWYASPSNNPATLVLFGRLPLTAPLSWIPVDNSGAGLVFSTASGQYIKWGPIVLFAFIVSFPVTANGLGINIAGLPFNVRNTNGSGGGVFIYKGSSNVADIMCYARENTNHLEFFNSAGGTIANSQFSNTFMEAFGFYFTSV